MRPLALLSVVFVTLLGARAQALPCIDDDALAEAAASLVLDGGALSEERVLDGASISLALLEAGSDLPAARALVASNDAAAARWLREVARRADAPVVCGVASSEGRQLVLAAPRGGRLVRAGDRVLVELADGFADAYVVLRLDDDELVRREIEHDAVRIDDAVRELQLVATGPSGPRPVASLRIARTSSPASGHSAPTADAPAIASDGTLGERLFALREHDGASDLRANRLLIAEAQRHAEHVCRSGSARHSQGTEDPEARLLRRGISARVVGEAVARGPSVDAAFDAIARSSSHRMAIVDRRFTDVGIGVAHRGATHCVVISLAAWPRAVPR